MLPKHTVRNFFSCFDDLEVLDLKFQRTRHPTECSSQSPYHTLKTLSTEDTTWQAKEKYWEGKGLVLDQDKASGCHSLRVGWYSLFCFGWESPLFPKWVRDSTFLPSHPPHCCLVLSPSLGCPHLTQLPLITWAHPKLFKFTATWCNPAFMSPLNPFRQLMPESAVVPFTQSHSNEQNLNRGRLN